jgi:hypothetical protein
MLKRGERVERSGSIGYYVGTTPAGIEWIWWGDPKAKNSGELFETVCKAFEEFGMRDKERK